MLCFFALTLLSGVSQQSTDTTGSLITASQTVGNFKTLKLKSEVGLWEMKMVSTNPYTLKVVGENPMMMWMNYMRDTNMLPDVVVIKLMFMFSMFPHWLIVFFSDFLLFAGESSIDFLFDFLEASEGLFGGFDVIDHRPRAGKGNRLYDRHMTFD